MASSPAGALRVWVSSILYLGQHSGTRYFSRGVDEDGNVSNYAETEQVVVSRGGAVASFSQVRGSIPVFWAQVTNTKYTPKLVIADRPETVSPFISVF